MTSTYAVVEKSWVLDNLHVSCASCKLPPHSHPLRAAGPPPLPAPDCEGGGGVCVCAACLLVWLTCSGPRPRPHPAACLRLLLYLSPSLSSVSPPVSVASAPLPLLLLLLLLSSLHSSLRPPHCPPQYPCRDCVPHPDWLLRCDVVAALCEDGVIGIL